MAILENCWKCKKQFITSAHGSMCCDDCNGVNEAKLAEKLRWAALGSEDKIAELLARVEALENHQCNPLIG